MGQEGKRASAPAAAAETAEREQLIAKEGGLSEGEGTASLAAMENSDVDLATSGDEQSPSKDDQSVQASGQLARSNQKGSGRKKPKERKQRSRFEDKVTLSEWDECTELFKKSQGDRVLTQRGPESPRKRQLRVVQIGRRGLDGQVSVSEPRLQPVPVGAGVEIGGSKPSSSSRFVRPAGGGYPPPAQEVLPEEEAGRNPARRIPPKPVQEGDGHNFFNVGYNQAPASRRAPENLLPYIPRRPEDVCKTYSHIFKILNDPHLKKKLPQQKQKLSVHVSMPRLPAAGASIAGDMQMFGSQSMPSFTSMETADNGGYVEGVVDPERVQLPPLARSR